MNMLTTLPPIPEMIAIPLLIAPAAIFFAFHILVARYAPARPAMLPPRDRLHDAYAAEIERLTRERDACAEVAHRAWHLLDDSGEDAAIREITIMRADYEATNIALDRLAKIFPAAFHGGDWQYWSEIDDRGQLDRPCATARIVAAEAKVAALTSELEKLKTIIVALSDASKDNPPHSGREKTILGAKP